MHEGSRRSGRTRSVYLLAGEFSSPRGEVPERVFKEPRTRGGAAPPSLEHLMQRACERAIDAIGGGDAAPAITHLLGITFPGRDAAFLSEVLNRFLELKKKLGLGERCQVRFELGSSDAGAVLFSSALQQLRGADGPATGLVVAGQSFPPNANVIDTIARVVEQEERDLGLNMIAVGDMLVDAIYRRWAAEAEGDEEEFRALLDAWVEARLRLAGEYRAAQRGPDDAATPPRWNRPYGRWMGYQHMAWASTGACAVVLTTDRALVERWIERARARGSAARLVRVLGVGEGDARGALTRRGEPFVYFKAMRQALSELRRATGTNLDFLRASAFAVLHDAFPSIELAFLLSLGFSPAEATQRALSWWPNPYGGLLAFGHALAASGLVQIARAFHTFTRPETYLARRSPESPHPDLAAAREPAHCVTASVGGPMTHVVATLLQSIPLDAAWEAHAERASVPPGTRRRWLTDEAPSEQPFAPEARHRLEEFDSESFERKTGWVVEMASRYREALGDEGALGVLEACTGLTLARLPPGILPLSRAFLDAWRPPPVRYRDWSTPLPDDAVAQVRSLLATAASESLDPLDEACELVEAHAARVADAWRAAHPDEGPEERVLRQDLRDAVYHALRLPVGLVAGPSRADGSDPNDATARRLCLLSGYVMTPDPPPSGALLRLQEAPAGARGLAVAVAVESSRPGLTPPWYLSPGRLGSERSYGPVRPPSGPLADDVQRLVASLRAGPFTRATLARLRDAASRGVEELLAEPAYAPHPGLIRLFHELVLDPDEDRARIVAALEAWLGGAALRRHDDDDDEVFGYCVVAMDDGGRATPRDLATRLEVVARAIRRTEGWFGGAAVIHERVGDFFAVTVSDPRAHALDASSWVPLARFAREVYQSCLREGVRVRAAACIDRGVRFREVDARQGVVGTVQLAVDRAVRHPAFQRAGGVALVARAGDVDPFDDIWRRVGAERFETVLDPSVLDAEGVGELTADPEDPGSPRFRFQIRRRAEG